MSINRQRKRYVIGNWKMHGSRSRNAELLSDLQFAYQQAISPQGVDMVVCPPSLYVQQVNAVLRQGSTPIKLGAQNVSGFNEGAYTGELSAAMLYDVGCDYVLVGHSERRTLFAESDECIAGKVVAALSHGVTPVLCVGETLDQYKGGVSEEIVREQIINVALKTGIKVFSDVIVAYEPVWAIGTGQVATSDYAQRIHAYIRQVLSDFDQKIADRMSILYGGSVNESNASSLFEQLDVDGALVGGASLDGQQFIRIAQALMDPAQSLAS